jgi:hypothetical protein
MNSDPFTFLQLVAVVVIWWFAVLGVAGKRFGMFHWLPTAICCFGIPMVMGDLLVQQPQVARWLFFTWHGVGLLLAAVYFARRDKSRAAGRNGAT